LRHVSRGDTHWNRNTDPDCHDDQRRHRRSGAPPEAPSDGDHSSYRRTLARYLKKILVHLASLR
jgi:hypothetical protein